MRGRGGLATSVGSPAGAAAQTTHVMRLPAFMSRAAEVTAGHFHAHALETVEECRFSSIILFLMRMGRTVPDRAQEQPEQLFSFGGNKTVTCPSDGRWERVPHWKRTCWRKTRSSMRAASVISSELNGLGPTLGSEVLRQLTSTKPPGTHGRDDNCAASGVTLRTRLWRQLTLDKMTPWMSASAVHESTEAHLAAMFAR